MGRFSADEWRSLSEYLDEALELEVAARPAWLTALKKNDPAVAERVARALAVSEASGFLDFPSFPPDTPAATLVGRAVGPYQIQAQIGQGGMGSVWRACRVDGRYVGKVAIKFVHAEWIGRSGEQRFRVEGNLLGRLDHPNIARLLDAGVLEGAQPYLILEYVEGESIEAYCRRHNLDAQSRVQLFLDVLAAVAHAHSHLIVHRDIKPGNIFVTHAGVVKLLDFGIAKLLDAEQGSSSGTKSSAAALTPLYAAPEQVLGQVVSTVTDVYSLGLVLYLLLTGSHPFSKSRSNAEIVHAVVTEVPVQASTATSIDSIPREALEGDLDNILHKALKKSPAERYASVGAFADDLQRFLAHQPVLARPDTLRYRTQKFVRRHRGGVTAAFLCAIAIVLGFMGTVWQADRAEKNATRALEQLSYAEAANEFLTFLLQEGSGRPFTTAQLLTRGENIVNRQFKDDAAVRARLLLLMGNLDAEVEEKAKALALFTSARAAASSVQDIALKASIDCSLALEYADMDEIDKALSMLDVSIKQARAAPALDRAVLAGCLDVRSQVYIARGKPVEGLADGNAALAVLGTPRAGQRTLDLSIRTSIGMANSLLGNQAVAAGEYTRAVDELRHMGRDQTDFAISLLNDLGVILARSGQWLRAAEVYERTLAIDRDESGGGEIRPVTQVNYAKLLLELGRAREALPLFDKAMETAKRRGDVRGVELTNLLSAPAWCAVGNLDECAARLDSVSKGLALQSQSGLPRVGTFETESAELAVDRGQLEQAQAHLHTALGIFGAMKERNPNELRALALQVEVELGLGNAAQAEADSDKLMGKARAALGGFPSGAWMGRAFLVRGEVLRARGRPGEAATELGRAVEILHSSAGDNGLWTRQARAELAAVTGL